VNFWMRQPIIGTDSEEADCTVFDGDADGDGALFAGPGDDCDDADADSRPSPPTVTAPALAGAMAHSAPVLESQR